MVGEKQFGQLVRAFGRIAPLVPDWRLRIFGDGPQRGQLQALSRKAGLYGRVELPASTRDMAGEWAKASVVALCSKAEGYPARAAGGDGRRRPGRELRLPVRAARDHRARRQRPARPSRLRGRAGRRPAAGRHRRRPAQPAGRRSGGDRAGLGRRRARRAVGADLRRGAGGPATRRTTPRGSAGDPRQPRTRRAADARPRRARPGHARPRAAPDPGPGDQHRRRRDRRVVRGAGRRGSPAAVALPVSARAAFLRGLARRARRRTSASATPATTAGPNAAARWPSSPRSSWAA